MKKVIVTGGAGYIGSHTVVQLVTAGYTPVIIDDFSNSEQKVMGRLASIIGDEPILYKGKVQQPGLLDRIFSEQGEMYAAIHFAASKAVGESVRKPLKYYTNNLESTITLISKMLEHRCGKLVFSSSCTVYGQPDKLPVTEESPRKDAESPYGNTKRICEDIIRDVVSVASGIQAVSLRYFNPIGAHPSGAIGELPLGTPENLVPYITQTASGIRDSVTVFGNDYNTPDGTAIRDYIHVLDLAEAHVKAIQYMNTTEKVYDVFNIGVGKGSTVLEVIQAFEGSTGVKLSYSIGDRRKGDVEQIYADASKANEVLNWKAVRSLNDSLKDAWNWQMKLKNA